MTAKPKIFVFSTAYHPFIGGAEIAIQEVAKRLTDRFDFLILTSRFRRDLLKKEIRPEGTVIRFGFGTPFDKFLLIPLAFFYFVRVYPRCYPRESAILWGMDIGQGSLAAAFIKIFFPRIPFILTLQYGESEDYLRRGRGGAIKFGLKFMLRRADFVTAISSYLLDLAKRYGYNGPGEVIHNGVDIEKFSRRNAQIISASQNTQIRAEVQNSSAFIGVSPKARHLRKSASTIITVSRLVPKNGIDTLIKAVAEIKKEFPEIRCHIIGDGPERKSLELQATNYQLQTNIKFFGSIPYDEIPRYLHAADVFVRPSRSEGMGNSFVEALAAGLPIIGTPVGGITDIIEEGKTGFFAKPDDPSDLAEKIKYVLLHSDEAHRSVENSQKIISDKFSWDNIARQYFSVFQCHYRGEISIVSPRKILIVTGQFPPDIGGPATYSKIILEGLPELGFRTDVLSFGGVRHIPKILRHFIYFILVLKKGFRSDIIFAQDPVSVGFPAALAARILRKKFVLKIVGDYAWEQGVLRFGVTDPLDDFLAKRQSFFVRIFQFVERFCAKQADKIIVPSRYLKTVIEKWGINGSKISVIYNSCDFSPLAARTRSVGDGLVIFSVGRLVPWKGMLSLVELMPEIRQKFTDANLWIAGDGPEKVALRAKIKSRALENSVFLLGSKSRTEMAHIFSKVDIFVLNTAYEGFSHTILEAMASGLPVVTTAVGGNPELVREGIDGFLVNLGDKKALRMRIENLLGDNLLRQKMSMNGRRRAAEFSVERMLRQTQIFLRECTK